MTRILLVEDDQVLARGVVAVLRDAGNAVDHVAIGGEVDDMLKTEPYGVVILDLGLPDMSGLDVLRSLRRRGSKIPILVLTARDAVQDRVAGLDAGADDYLLKPFDTAELEARIRALLRRGAGDPSPLLTIGSLSLDRASNETRINGRIIDLRRREAAVLMSLATRAGKIVPKERLAAEVFDFDDPVAPNALELYVARVRKKLQPDGPRIRTLRGLGYILETPGA